MVRADIAPTTKRIAIKPNDPEYVVSSNKAMSDHGQMWRRPGAQFDGDKMIELGREPIVAEVIDSIVRVKTIHGEKMKVWA